MADLNVVQVGYQASSDFSQIAQSPKVSDEGGMTGALNVQVPKKSAEAIQSSRQDSLTETTQNSGSIENKAELSALVENINRQMQKFQNYLRFEQDQDAQKWVIYIKDSETDEVIRQIPAKEFLEVSKNITRFLEAQQTLNRNDSIVSRPVGFITNQMA